MNVFWINGEDFIMNGALYIYYHFYTGIPIDTVRTYHLIPTTTTTTTTTAAAAAAASVSVSISLAL